VSNQNNNSGTANPNGQVGQSERASAAPGGQMALGAKLNNKYKSNNSPTGFTKTFY